MLAYTYRPLIRFIVRFPTPMLNRTAALILLVIACGPAFAQDPPVAVEQVEVKGLWHHGAHNAFTDLIRWRDRFYCTFREGYQHVSYDGKIRVLVSEDGETWKPAALFVLPGYDLRDPELEITPRRQTHAAGTRPIGARPTELRRQFCFLH